MWQCPKCGTNVANISSFCPKCGYSDSEGTGHMLPECSPYFDKEQLTDKPERFFVNEIIREKILLNYDKEIPYSVEVEVEQFKEEDTIINIVDRDWRQKEGRLRHYGYDLN